MSRNDRPTSQRRRRSVLGVGMAVGAAFAAALIASGPAARADAPDPFEDLFPIDSWTPGADAWLLSSDPTEAANLDASVESFLANESVSLNFPQGDDQFTFLLWTFDPTAFTPGVCGYGCLPPGLDPAVLPDSNIADYAVGLDYTLFATGIGGNDLGLYDLLGPIESIPAYIGGLGFLLALIFG